MKEVLFLHVEEKYDIINILPHLKRKKELQFGGGSLHKYFSWLKWQNRNFGLFIYGS
jgi:hypothetical protein